MKQHHRVDMDDARKFERFRCVLRVVVVLSAIDLVWDSPMCPFPGEKHREEHFLHVEKHLVATVQQAIFVIGLLMEQWQDNTRIQVVSTMRRVWFKNAGEKYRAMLAPVALADTEVSGADRPQPPDGMWVPDRNKAAPSAKEREQALKPEVAAYQSAAAAYDGMVEEKKNWMYDTLPLGGSAMSTVQPSRGQIASTQDILAHLTNQLMRHMHPRPLDTEVQAVLHRMTQETVETSRTVEHPDGRMEVVTSSAAALLVDPRNVRVALNTLESGTKSDMLFGAVESVLSTLFNNGAHTGCGGDGVEYLYGETEPENPNVWRMVRACKTPAGRAKEGVARTWAADFFDDAVKSMTKDLLQSTGDKESSHRLAEGMFRSTTPWLNVDIDIDLQAARRHAIGLGLNETEQRRTPSNITRESEDQLMEYWLRTNTEPMLRYPECIGSRDRAATARRYEAMYKRDPSKFSMKSEYDRMGAAQAALHDIDTEPQEESSNKRQCVAPPGGAVAATTAAFDRMQVDQEDWCDLERDIAMDAEMLDDDMGSGAKVARR